MRMGKQKRRAHLGQGIRPGGRSIGTGGRRNTLAVRGAARLAVEVLESRTLLAATSLDAAVGVYLPPQYNLLNFNGFLSGPASGAASTLGSGVSDIVSADFNGDGKPDVALTTYIPAHQQSRSGWATAM